MSNKKSQNRTANRMTSPHYMVMDESEDDEEQQQNNKKDMKEFMIDTANKFLTFIVRYDTEPKTVADEIETIITGISPLERERRVKLCNEYREIRSSLTAEFGTEDTEKFVELTEERMNRMASFLTFVDLRSRNDPEEISLADDEAKFYMTSSCNRHARAYNLGPFTLTQKEQGECCNEDCYKKTTYYIGGTIMKLYHSDVCKNRRDAMLDAAIAKSVEIGTYFETPMRSYSHIKSVDVITQLIFIQGKAYPMELVELLYKQDMMGVMLNMMCQMQNGIKLIHSTGFMIFKKISS